MRGLASAIAGPPTFTWFGGPPQGPSIPFGNATLAVFDSMRLICLALVAVSVVFAVVLIDPPLRRSGAADQAGLAGRARGPRGDPSRSSTSATTPTCDSSPSCS
jgi:hypothetical protein